MCVRPNELFDTVENEMRIRPRHEQRWNIEKKNESLSNAYDINWMQEID